MFEWETIAVEGKARRGRFSTPHGKCETPMFMPVGTAGTVKGITPKDLRETGAQMILANTYHLMLRPGDEGVAKLGGLHKLMAWDGPILTDSGGYQVFSLAHMRSISDDGVEFQSHIDGARVSLTPARAVEIQRNLGSDVMMQLDVCPPGKAPREEVALAVKLSADWAARGKEAWNAAGRMTAQRNPQALFGIQQGGVFDDLRAESARRIVDLDLPGYAIGGLSVGEGHQAMCDVLEEMDNLMPADKPRYLMGVGEPRDILAAVLRGVDMFDCVMPTRNGRNAQAFTWTGRLKLRNSRFTADTQPIEPKCDCYTCRNFSRGTIRHLFTANEMLGPILVTIHNLQFFSEFTAAIRKAVEAGNFTAFARRWEEQMYPDAE